MSAAATQIAEIPHRPVIGIHDGHNASVAVIENGRLRFALQEERLTRIKNQGDAPVGALKQALALVASPLQPTAGLAPLFALNGQYMNYGQWRREVILDDYARSSTSVSRVKQFCKNTFLDRFYQSRKAADRADALEAAGIDPIHSQPVEHHLAHASAAYHTCPWPDQNVLVFTCDGSGDRLSATVNIGAHGKLSRLTQVSEHDSIGRLYALVTRWLGMVPLEHEYKVMGLAPYVGSDNRAVRIASGFAGWFEFSRDGLSWGRRPGVPSLYSAYEWMAGQLAGQRFDLVAAGVQSFLEQWLVRWVRNAIRETGIPRVACAGGVFMNVKANLAVLEIPELEEMYVFPSCGDESNSIGAACHVAASSGQRIERLGPIYFGRPISDAEVELALGSTGGNRVRSRWVADIESQTADALSLGKVVARAKGQAEFGARALGNRSILARADSPDAVRVINQMVKNRDFWMPFAPSVLSSRAGDYYAKPKPVDSPHMMFAFPSCPKKRTSFSAAQHAYDFTARPQEVCENFSPDYYRLLKEFESRTGEGVLLNTSFNLHGEPIVHRASEALDVFNRSGLEYMALGNWWIEKRAA